MEFMKQTQLQDAAVLAPLIEKDGELHLLFEVRDSSISQGGDVSFPGGRMEDGEDGALAAIRETAEELLVSEDQVELLAPLFQFTGPGGRRIFSYMGLLHDYRYTYSSDEVARVFTVPLSYFLENEPLITTTVEHIRVAEDFPIELVAGGKNYHWRTTERQVYFYQVQGEVIWGMTAELLHAMAERMKKENI